MLSLNLIQTHGSPFDDFIQNDDDSNNVYPINDDNPLEDSSLSQGDLQRNNAGGFSENVSKSQ